MQTLYHTDLKSRHTLAATATAETLLIVENLDELTAIEVDDHILGGGSNTIFVGEVKQRLVHLAFAGITVTGEDADSVTVRALAGTIWHDFVRYTIEQGWYGLENLALIPGTVGAAPVQNIGAYGVECKDSLESVEVYDRREQIFEPFFSKRQGIGLGLYLVREMCLANQATIVYVPMQKGACFRIKMERYLAEQALV